MCQQKGILLLITIQAEVAYSFLEVEEQVLNGVSYLET